MTSALVAMATALAFFALIRRAAPAGRVDLTPLVFLKAPLNQLAFWIRSNRRPSSRAPAPIREPKVQLFAYLDDAVARVANDRARALAKRFDLGALERESSREVYRHNLYVLDLLERHATRFLGSATTLRAIDAGSQDFRYATALERWLAHAGSATPRAVSLDGIEVDGHGIYADHTTRASHGVHNAALTGNPRVTYRVEDFCKTSDWDMDVVFAWFPFVLPYALVQWGLPLKLFAPDRFFQRAADALTPGGLLIVATHTDEERKALAEILEGIDELEVVDTQAARSNLVEYWEDLDERALTIAKKRA